MRDEGAFFNREGELAQLEATWATLGAQLVTLWGRRRVGKSTLLARFAADKRAIYLYGTRMTERDILIGLALQAAATFDDPYLRAAPFPSWSAALDYLAARAAEARLLIVFDEFSYLCEVTPGLDTLVQRWWDTLQGPAQPMVVVASSAFSFMAGLTGARGPLHGRRTGQVEVLPFDYYHAAHFFPWLAPDDRLRAYACFGGIPAYLRHWQPTDDLATTVQRTLLHPGHVLFREAEELLRTEFHQEAVYVSILRAVANGQHRPSDIARAVGRDSADDIFDHLRRLQELHMLRREVPVTELGRPRTQRVLYRLADPYLRCWFHFVSPFQALIQLGRGATLWQGDIAPALDAFVARTTWEEVCAQYLWRLVAADRLPIRMAQLGRWWDNADEVDLVGLWRDRAVLVGECKWTNAPVGEGVLADLQRKASKLPLADAPRWLLASRTGFTAGLRRAAAARDDLLLVEPPDLFAQP